MQIAFFGGIYSNYLALAAAIADARGRGVDGIYCLGDLGAFGPHPDRVFPLLVDNHIQCVQGNYDHSIGNELRDCQCGYTDPRDNHFAQLSYDYTLQKTSPHNRDLLRLLPGSIRLEIEGLRLHLCHGSPRQTNEFLWESTTSTQFLDRLADQADAEVILGTHTGIHWQRELSRGRRFINVGVLGRPENDGRTNVWYAILDIRGGQGDSTGTHAEVSFVPVEYDYQRLAREMRDEQIPEEFVETILTGWWTTCLEVLPSKERRRGRM